MTDDDGMRLGELEGTVAEKDGYTAESDAAILLDGLDIPETLHDRKMSELQGGQKVRVLLAQALFGGPDALLLDEPTNHLDLDSIHWLQDFMLRYQGTLIVISHDRHFLNSVCTHIADIDYQTIITQVYRRLRRRMVLAKTQITFAHRGAERAAREEDRSSFKEFIARFSAGTRSSQVTSRKKEVERLQTSDLAKSNIARPFIRFEMKRPSEPASAGDSRDFEVLRRSRRDPRLHRPAFPAARRSACWAATAWAKRLYCAPSLPTLRPPSDEPVQLRRRIRRMGP